MQVPPPYVWPLKTLINVMQVFQRWSSSTSHTFFVLIQNSGAICGNCLLILMNFSTNFSDLLSCVTATVIVNHFIIPYVTTDSNVTWLMTHRNTIHVIDVQSTIWILQDNATPVLTTATKEPHRCPYSQASIAFLPPNPAPLQIEISHPIHQESLLIPLLHHHFHPLRHTINNLLLRLLNPWDLNCHVTSNISKPF